MSAARLRASWALVGLVGALGSACFDLFHSTDFDVCPSVGAAAGCGEAGVDATRREAGRDAGQDSHASRDGGRDSTAIRDAGHDSASDGDSGVVSLDASDGAAPHDTGVSDTGIVDGEAPIDAGTNFCAFSPAEAAAHAERACLWLGACVGNSDLNEYGRCYPLALQAYDCALNPDQRVRPGPLHAFWEALLTAGGCDDVRKATLGANPAPCSQPPGGCGSPDASGGGVGDLVVTCADGGYSTLVNCRMAGYTCNGGACGNGVFPCVDAGPGCIGNTLHACQRVEVEGGTTTAVVDVGRDCTSFGGGLCFAEGGAAGCVPAGSTGSCDASTSVTCTGDATATGCATGHPETIQCGLFGARATCYPASGTWVASSLLLASACLNLTPLVPPACPQGSLLDNAGPSGKVEVACADAGFGTCMATTSGPFCQPP